MNNLDLKLIEKYSDYMLFYDNYKNIGIEIHLENNKPTDFLICNDIYSEDESWNVIDDTKTIENIEKEIRKCMV